MTVYIHSKYHHKFAIGTRMTVHNLTLWYYAQCRYHYHCYIILQNSIFPISISSENYSYFIFTLSYKKATHAIAKTSLHHMTSSIYLNGSLFGSHLIQYLNRILSLTQ